MNRKSTALVSMAFAFFFGVAHADGGDYTMPAAAPSHDPAYKPTTCAEKATMTRMTDAMMMPIEVRRYCQNGFVNAVP